MNKCRELRNLVLRSPEGAIIVSGDRTSARLLRLLTWIHHRRYMIVRNRLDLIILRLFIRGPVVIDTNWWAKFPTLAPTMLEILDSKQDSC